MAVAFDAVGPSSSGIHGTNVATLSWSHTCGAGATALVVFANTSTTTTVTGVTYNSAALTRIGSQAVNNNNTDGTLYGYAMANPATGLSLTVQVTFSDNGSNDIEAASMSFTGAGGTFGTAGTGGGSGVTASAVVPTTTTTGQIAFAACGGSAYGANPTAPAVKEWLNNASGGSAAGNQAGGISASTGGNVTVAWGLSSDFWACVGFEVLPAVAAAPPAATGGMRNVPVIVPARIGWQGAAHSQ